MTKFKKFNMTFDDDMQHDQQLDIILQRGFLLGTEGTVQDREHDIVLMGNGNNKWVGAKAQIHQIGSQQQFTVVVIHRTVKEINVNTMHCR